MAQPITSSSQAHNNDYFLFNLKAFDTGMNFGGDTTQNNDLFEAEEVKIFPNDPQSAPTDPENNKNQAYEEDGIIEKLCQADAEETTTPEKRPILSNETIQRLFLQAVEKVYWPNPEPLQEGPGTQPAPHQDMSPTGSCPETAIQAQCPREDDAPSSVRKFRAITPEPWLEANRQQTQQPLPPISVLKTWSLSIPRVFNYDPSVPTCTICLEIFTTYLALLQHMVQHTITEERARELVHGKTFKAFSFLDNMLAGGRPKCRNCFKFFNNLDELKSHTLTHKGGFKCRACKHRSPSMEDLNEHEAIHKKHECAWCGKKFFRTDNLRAHILVHTGEHAFHCTNCPKAYKHDKNLKKHLRKCLIENKSPLSTIRQD